MTDYKAMYLTLFHGTEEVLAILEGCCGDMDRLQKAVNALTAAQQQCEDLYVESTT